MKNGDVIELEIIDLAVGGKGLGKVKVEDRDFAVFVDGALPGQTVEAKLSKKKRRYAEAKLVKVLKASNDEVDTGYQSVSGAPWATLPVEIQQSYKKKQVVDLFRKFAETDLEPIFDEYVSSPETWNYRNKMEFSFGPTDESYEVVDDKKVWSHSGFGLGSKRRGQFWLVDNLEKPSGLFDEAFEALLPTIREWCESTGESVYNAKTETGFFRYLVVRKSYADDGFLVNLVTSEDDLVFHPLIDILRKGLGERLKAFVLTRSNDTGNAVVNYATRDVLFGTESFKETLTVGEQELSFKVSLDSFFQTNVKSAEKLYGKTLDYVTPKDGENIFDCFCGTGTIAQILAKSAPKAKLYGIEIVEAAIEDARASAEKNDVSGIKFFASDVGAFLKTHPEFVGKMDTIVLDPPRAGIAPKTLGKVIDLGAKKIVYVSCNPSTMARDTVLLKEAGYKLEKFSLVDQFPHTSHVEAVGRFILT